MKICLVCEGMSETEQATCPSCGTRLVQASEVHFPFRRGEEDAANPLLGALLDGKYRITNVLGKGGMGTVFRAVHEVSLAPVALKVLHPRYAGRAEHRDHFLGEARKAGSVVHEHSARILDVGEDADGTVYIAMEMVEGETLAEWIHQGERLGPAVVVDLLLQVCQALAAAHDVGLVHRDLSPRNVMGLLREGRPFVKILDFGIAKGASASFTGRPIEGEGTAPPAGFANPPYSAPEHLEGHEVDARADLYSLGVIAYEALTRRLPVEGHTARDLARATVEGRLRPLRAPSGTPSRLVRLITRLLSRDPDDRPASARDVMRELNRIGNPRGLVLRTLAVASLFVTLPAFVVAAYVKERQVFLDPQPGTVLVLSEERAGPDQVQKLRSSDLDNLQFQCGGFDPRQLVMEAGYLGGELPAVAASVAVEQQVLTFSCAATPGYRELLAEIARRDEVELVLRVPGRAGLKYATVLVDDEPPVTKLGALPPGNPVLSGSTVIDCPLETEDKSGLAQLALVISWDEDGVRRERNIPMSQRAEPAAQLLGRYFPGVQARTDVEMFATAADNAGNVAKKNVVLHFDRLDLAAPEIVGVRGRGSDGQVTYDPQKGARIHVSLDSSEPGAVFRVWFEDHSHTEVLGAGTEHDVLLPPMNDDPGVPFVDGTYRFSIKDEAGNQSAEKNEVLAFRSEDPEISLRVEPAAGEGAVRGVVVEDGDVRVVLTDGAGVRLAFRCNSLYAVERVTLRSSTRVDSGPQVLDFGEVGPGNAAFDLPELPDGEYRLAIDLVDRGETKSVPPWTVHALRGPVELRLPDAAARRFLRQQVDVGLLNLEDGDVLPGRAWRVVPADVRLLRGQIWFGRRDSLVPRRLAPRRRWDDPLFERQAALHGENVLAVELRDLLDRPVSVRIGGEEVVGTILRDGTIVDEVAVFLYDPGPVVSDREVTEVEYRQPAKIVLRSPLPFQLDDGVQLLVGADRSSPVAIEPDGGGSRLTFSVHYDVLARAARLRDLAPAELSSSSGHPASLTVRLETPVRHHDIQLDVRITRSTLQPVRWQQIADSELPPELLDIVMVPLLGPDGEYYEDPVSESAPERALFRPMPVLRVRNVEDLFLQSGEMTRRQYQALVAAATALADDFDTPERLVHAWDPDGVARLRAMRPAMFEGEADGWSRAVAQAGDRPVTGVDFFQAYTAARVAGVVVAGDPSLFRLPMGLELELAALGAGSERTPGALHGGGRQPPGMTIGGYLALGAGRGDPSAWPPTRGELLAAGDALHTRQGHELTGLDFGVREWVFDLPYLPAIAGREVLTLRLGDHGGHLADAMDFARGAVLRPAGDASSSPLAGLEAELRRVGVVRGSIPRDRSGSLAARSPDVELPDDVTGVVRILVLRRDGRGLLGDPDPNLRDIGFRLAGGRAFVREVRR